MLYVNHAVHGRIWNFLILWLSPSSSLLIVSATYANNFFQYSLQSRLSWDISSFFFRLSLLKVVLSDLSSNHLKQLCLFVNKCIKFRNFFNSHRLIKNSRLLFEEKIQYKKFSHGNRLCFSSLQFTISWRLCYYCTLIMCRSLFFSRLITAIWCLWNKHSLLYLTSINTLSQLGWVICMVLTDIKFIHIK